MPTQAADATQGPGVFEAVIITVITMLLSTVFMFGRWSASKVTTTAEVGVQKEEAIIPQHLRAENKRLYAELERLEHQAEEAQMAADEFQRALNMIMEENTQADQMLAMGAALLRASVREMDKHRLECPLKRGVLVCRRGRRFHLNYHCSSVEGRDSRMQEEFYHCSICSERLLPPDYATVPGGNTLRTSVANWLEAHAARFNGTVLPP